MPHKTVASRIPENLLIRYHTHCKAIKSVMYRSSTTPPQLPASTIVIDQPVQHVQKTQSTG
ncbi:hypothetical protein [Nitrosomonas aestuarii]|uniref:hypothetical protein n=1 Tax=Nitrosomonas aestuarii TaxID=52441 RepID=UPI001BA57510|nr:hypothetical protein [Nitrosomonas aestuarii]